MTRLQEQVAERFAFDVLSHQMTVLHDDGRYRHLRFRRPETSTYWFDLVTWPGCLAINGDMQTFVFSRLTDMFEFFRGPGPVNVTYWAEKLRASSDVEGYDEEKFREVVNEIVAEHEADWPGLAKAVENEIFDAWSGTNTASEDLARLAISEFSYKPEGHEGEPFRFMDAWEWNLHEYRYQFLWCLHAIQWGIRKYDAAQHEAVNS